MANWFHRFFNPHCPHCMQDKVCNSCENLKYEIARVTGENNRLLERILERPEPTVEPRVAPDLTAVPPRINTWAVRKSMLEAEDREKAKILRNAPTPIEQLEKDLLDAGNTREKESSKH